MISLLPDFLCAAALAAACFGGDAAKWTGRGTGVDDAGLALKEEVVAPGVSLHGGQGDGVEMLRRLGIKYISLNPGASYRGLHDSLVNYGENDPPMILCNHEKLAVQIAHGYTKATGKPMAAAVHNVVGLLHAPLAIYYAYIDRCPVFDLVPDK